MNSFLLELQSLIDEGGIVLWLMLLLCIVLYTVLASSWWGLLSLKRQINDFGQTLDKAPTRDLVADEADLFELKKLAWVHRRLPVLSVLIALAPLSGLLGTVAGMLTTFAGMTSASTTKPIDSISTGISQALITTQAGLLMAIPAALLLALLKSQFEHVRGILDQFAAQRSATLSLP